MSRRGRKYSDEDRLAVRGRLSLVSHAGRVVALRKRGAYWWGRCPFHNEKTGSFRVSETKGTWKCYGCGAGGDIVEFEMRAQHIGFVEAMQRLLDEAGLAPDTPEARKAAQDRRDYEARLQREEEQRKAAERQRCREIVDRTMPASGTLVEAYFRSRGLSLSPEAFPRLRFHPALKYWTEDDTVLGGFRCLGIFPAVVALIQRPDGVPMGLHITYLDDEGRKLDLVDQDTGEILAARKMRGEMAGGAVQLRRPGTVLGIGEGWETCLSVLQAAMRRPAGDRYRALPVWAALSLHNFAGGGKGMGAPHPDDPRQRLPSTVPDLLRPGLLPPTGVREVVLIEDGDTKDLAVGRAIGDLAANRWRARGLIVRRIMAPRGLDYNDLVRG